MEVFLAGESFAGGYQGHTLTRTRTVVSFSFPRGAAVTAAGPSVEACVPAAV